MAFYYQHNLHSSQTRCHDCSVAGSFATSIIYIVLKHIGKLDQKPDVLLPA